MRFLILPFLLISASLSHSAEPISIFDGKTLDGWDYDPQVWRVEDGMITGGSRTEKIKENFFICTNKSYQNFDLKLKIKVSGDPATGLINSGIQIRSLRVPGSAHMCGYQVDCGQGWFGKIYDEFRRNKVIAEPVDASALEKVVDVFGWNEYRIRAEGSHIQTWINGVLAIDYMEQDKNISLDGLIGPQVHSGGICLVQVKDVTIEELPPTANAPTWESLGGVEAARKLVAPAPKAKAAAFQNIPGKKRDTSYNNVQGAPKTAAEQQKLFHLPEGYEIELVVQESPGIGKFVSVYFDQRGRLWTQTALEYPVDANENPAAAEAVYQAKGKDKILVYPREALNQPLPKGGLTNPTIYADGLAIPLGILPWGNGDQCYTLHGHDLLLLSDTNGDGKSDKSKVILTGFGIQDSHLFPHQFTRAPGGWIWMAQGLFNNSSVKRPGSNEAIDFPKCSMARMRPDGSEFEVTSTGPNNIWGLVMTGEGETFIQEANDYGYPVMPFHEYAYYPGGMAALRKSYQPEFPPAAEFRMGGTGLSGLALGEGGFRKLTPTAKEDDLCMFVANPITSKIQTLAMHRDGPYWNLEQATDLITCEDPFFRPVGMTNGPDGSIYIVDWYNKIISHNEVPRNHPDRDKTRGRIWRIVPKDAIASDPKGARTLLSASKTNAAQPPVSTPSTHQSIPDSTSKEAGRSAHAPLASIPDFTQLSAEDLIDLLGTQPTAKAHLAWQTLADRDGTKFVDALDGITMDDKATASQRIQALWCLDGVGAADSDMQFSLLEHNNKNVRREVAFILGNKLQNTDGNDYPGGEHIVDERLAKLQNDLNSEVRFKVIQSFAAALKSNPKHQTQILSRLLSFAKPSLTDGPTIQSSRSPAQVPAREAYDREFERFLVRMFLERHADKVAKFLDSEAAAKLPVEARVLASLALEPKASAARVAKLLPQLDRAPNDEELLRLAQFPNEPGVGESLKALLANKISRNTVAEKLLNQRTSLDAGQIAPLLTQTAKQMITEVETPTSFTLACSLISSFQLTDLEIPLVDFVRSGKNPVTSGLDNARLLILTTLRDLHSGEAELFTTLAKSDPDPLTRDAALAALASSRSPNAVANFFTLYPELTAGQRKAALNTISSTKSGAKKLVTALLDKSLPQSDLDGTTIERLATVLGDDPALAQLQQQLGGIFHEVLLLDGQNTAWVDSKITLEGPFTVECWVRLTEDIGNEDCILGTPNDIQLNFFGSKFRVYAGSALHDVAVSKKPMTPDLWTHIAVTRDAKGICRIYQNGELDATASKPAPQKFEDCRIGWSQVKNGTQGAITEFRAWNRERTPSEIRATFDRYLAPSTTGLTYSSTDRFKSKQAQELGKGARIAKTLDTPPLLTEEQAKSLDTKFAHYSALAPKGNAANGKALSAICMACHQIGNAGGQIGPNLSGAGSMGLEGVLRNILTPNAAMESGYRIYRVELTNGDLIDAFFVSEDKQATIIRQPGLPDRRLDKKDIRHTQYIRRSIMPEGLLDSLQDQQVADLLAYLMTLKG